MRAWTRGEKVRIVPEAVGTLWAVPSCGLAAQFADRLTPWKRLKIIKLFTTTTVAASAAMKAMVRVRARR